MHKNKVVNQTVKIDLRQKRIKKLSIVRIDTNDN